jgi:RNA-directed DNA polymerase
MQHQGLCRALTGNDAYFGIPGNPKRLRLLHYQVRRFWQKWLSRRSSKSYVEWVRYARMLERFGLPQARIVHACAVG